jgi:aminopeptidase
MTASRLAFKSGAARMAIAGANPALLAGQDPDKVSRASTPSPRPTSPRWS